MRKIVLPIVAILFISCTGLTQKWDKPTAKKAFMDQLPETGMDNFTPEMIDQLCDCMADKAVARYKSLSEANADEAGMKEFGADCGKELIQKSIEGKIKSMK